MRILVLILLLLSGAAPAQTTWRAVTEYPATAMPGEGLALFAKRLGELTAGALQVQPGYDAPDGLRSATIPQAVQAGRIQIGDAFAGALAGMDPVFQLSSLPFAATSQDEARRLYDAARPAYVQAFSKAGQVLLYATPWPATGLWSRDAVSGPNALRGLKLRSYDAISTAVMRRAGADPVELSFADAMPRLKDGSVTAVLSSGDGGAGRRLWDYTRHFTAIGYAMPLSFTTINAELYAALPPPQRQAVDQAAAETEAAQWQALVRRTDANYAAMRTNGVVITEPSPALASVLREAAAQSIRDWSATAGTASAILDRVRPR